MCSWRERAQPLHRVADSHFGTSDPRGSIALPARPRGESGFEIKNDARFAVHDPLSFLHSVPWVVILSLSFRQFHDLENVRVRRL